MNPHLKSVMRTEPYAAYIGRRPTEVMLSDLEQHATECGLRTFVSGAFRLDVERNTPGCTTVFTYYLNGRATDSREDAVTYIESARAAWTRQYGL